MVGLDGLGNEQINKITVKSENFEGQNWPKWRLLMKSFTLVTENNEDYRVGIPDTETNYS